MEILHVEKMNIFIFLKKKIEPKQVKRKKRAMTSLKTLVTREEVENEKQRIDLQLSCLFPTRPLVYLHVNSKI